MAVIVAIGMLFTGCAGRKGPTLKEQVNQSLEHFYRGEEMARKRNFTGALEEYLASIEISPRPRAYYHLALIENEMGNRDEAIRYLDEALKLSPNFTMAAQAKKQLQALDRTSSAQTAPIAIPTEEEMIADAPVETTTIETPQVETKPAEPMETKKETISVATTPASTEDVLDTEAQAIVGAIKKAENARDWRQTIELCNKLLVQYPTHAVTLNRLGFAHYQTGDFNEAEKSFTHAVQAHPNFADAYNNLGVVRENLGQSAEAGNAYEKAIEVGNHVDACFNLAVLKEKEGEYKASISYYEKYLQLDSQSMYADLARERIQKLRRIEY
jgi:tetratricopeptide (TPR) repeat protein